MSGEDKLLGLISIAAKGRNLVSGAFATEKAVKEGKAFLVIVADDAGDNTKGLIGVVGPTRMDYSTVAAKLRFLAAGLSRRLGSGEAPPEGLHNKLILKKNEDSES